MKKKTFQSQLILSFLLIMFLVFFTIFSLLLITGFQGSRKDIEKELKASADLVSAQFGSIVENMMFVSTYTLSEMETVDAMAWLSTGSLTDSEELSAYRTVQSALINYSIVSSIYHMTYFNEAGYIIQSDQYNLQYNQKVRLDKADWEQINWLDLVQNNHGRTVLLPVQQRLFVSDSKQALMLVRAVRNSRGIVGYLIVETTIDEIANVLSYETDHNATLLITAADGTLIYASDTLPDVATEQIITENVTTEKQQGYLYATAENSGLDLHVTMVVPKSALWHDSLNFLSLYIMEGISILCVAVLAILLLSKRLTHPIAELSKQMQKTDLNSLSIQQKTNTQYPFLEIDSLYSSFVSMQERLHLLVNREIAWKTRQAEQQLQILQTQINPHFMYNTLNMIGIMGYESGNMKIVDVCRAFSELLRYSISDKSNSVTTIENEIKNIQNYLSLMQMRYGQACTYEITEDAAVSQIKIPRLSLQPFVENVFEHGYNSHTTTVNIHIRTAGTANFWEIEIRDNGCGMELDKLQNLREQIEQYILESETIHSEISHTSIGLKNTLSRLNLYYNGQFTWRIDDAKPGLRILLQGTRREDDLQ